jgi:hypothetical protein
VSKHVHRLLHALLMAVVLTSVLVGRSRPELAWDLGAIAVGGYLVFALVFVARMARLPRPPGMLRQTGESLAISGTLIAFVLFVQWMDPLAAVLILLALFAIVSRRRVAVTPY